MRNKEIKDKLQQEAERYVPDTKEVARRAFLAATVGVSFNLAATVGVASKRRKFHWAYAALPAAAAFILAIVLTFVFLPMGGGTGGSLPTVFTESVVRIDINPSVKFYVGEDGLVTKQAPCNEDGAVLLMKKDFVGVAVVAAAEEVVALAGKCGYLNNTNKVVALKVLNDNPNLESALRTQINAAIVIKVNNVAPQAEVIMSGKNEVVDFLVATKKYTRKEAEKLSAEQMENVIETLMKDNSGDELNALLNTLNDGIIRFLNSRRDDGANILKVMKKYSEAVDVTPAGEHFKMEDDDQNTIKVFLKKYDIKCAITNFNRIEPKKYELFLETIVDEQDELDEAMEELEEDPEEISDVLEDWYDQYKKYIKNYK